MADELIPVNLVVGDRTYRVRIHPRDEGTVRATVKTIQDKLLEFKTAFAGKDMQDYVAMVLLWYATSGAESARVSGGDREAEWAGLEAMLDKALQK